MQVFENWLDMHVKLFFVLTTLKISKPGCSSISLFTSIEIQAGKNGEITRQF